MTNPYFSADAHARRLGECLDRAAALHARGFTSEASRKEALDWVNRAYDEARSIFAIELRTQFPWDEAKRSYPEAYFALSDVAPYGLHQWRPKHAQALAGYPDFVGRVETLAALREGIKGQALIAKQPKPKTPAQIAKEAQQMTCQICGRAIFAETGVIAHHGYERPGSGWQTASCEGARELPFEVSSAALADHLLAIGRAVIALQAEIVEVGNERRALVWTWQTKEFTRDRRGLRVYSEQRAAVTRATYDMVAEQVKATQRFDTTLMTFDALKEAELFKLGARLGGLRQYRETQGKRLAAWKATHRAGKAGEKAWVAL